MDEKITLKKVNVIGEKFFHVFEDALGNQVEVETTEADYRQLGSKTPKNPVKKGYVWIGSHSRYKLDTIDGNLNEGEYYNNGNGYMAKINNKFIQAKKEEIINDEIDSTIVADAISKLEKYGDSL